MNNKVVIGIVAAILLLCGYMYVTWTPNYNWYATFSGRDKNPLGCAIFDEVMTGTFGENYSVKNYHAYELVNKDTCRFTFLFTVGSLAENEKDMTKLLKRGHNVIIASDNLYELAGDYSKLVPCDVGQSWINVNSNPNLHCEFVNFKWNGDSTAFRVRKTLMGGWMKPTDSDFIPLITRTLTADELDLDERNDVKAGETVVVAMEKQVGKGKLIVVSNPYLFTNYGMRDVAMQTLAFRILSRAGKRPVMRIDYTLPQKHSDENEEYSETGETTFFNEFYKYPPLRWAVYAAFFTLIVGMLFTARRRQRVIPVISRPVNYTMSMIEHIGMLYFHRRDNHDLVKKKYMYFTEQLRRGIMVDIDDWENINVELDMLATHTGLNREILQSDIEYVQRLISFDERVSDAEMMRAIDIMDDISSRMLSKQ